MNYVMHFCRNKKCNNGWIDKDLTNAKTFPPDWKYCKECAEKLGIDYDAQTPTSNLTKKELEHREKILEKQKLAVAARKNKTTSTGTGQEQMFLSRQDNFTCGKFKGQKRGFCVGRNEVQTRSNECRNERQRSKRMTGTSEAKYKTEGFYND